MSVSMSDKPTRTAGNSVLALIDFLPFTHGPLSSRFVPFWPDVGCAPQASSSEALLANNAVWIPGMDAV